MSTTGAVNYWTRRRALRNRTARSTGTAAECGKNGRAPEMADTERQKTRRNSVANGGASPCTSGKLPGGRRYRRCACPFSITRRHAETARYNGRRRAFREYPTATREHVLPGDPGPRDTSDLHTLFPRLMATVPSPPHPPFTFFFIYYNKINIIYF